MSNFNIKGVDISNNNSISDLSTLKDNGVEYVYLKATEGATFKDNKSIDRYSKCRDLGLKVGFYHFLVSTSTPEAQAENFYNYIKDFSSNLVPMLDVEKDWNGMSNAAVRFINKFKELSNMKIGIYTYSGFLCNFTQQAIDVIKDLPCWIANYTSNYDNVNVGFFTNVVGWQYSENGTIGTFTGDCNMFNEGCLLNANRGIWKQNNNGWWYYDGVNYPISQWKQIDGDWYYFDENGYAYQNRWLKYKDKWYYFKDSCKMAHGETLSYSFNDDGSFIE